VDSITQIALGAAIGDAAFSRKLGPRAMLFGGACGLLPDLDMFAGLFGDEWTTFVHHRGLSHSLLVLPLVAPLAAWLGWRWDGKRTPWLVWAHLAFWSLCTHPVLDWFTSYGTQLFAPATWHRYANDGIFIIDPIYSIPLFVALVWSWCRRSAPLREARHNGLPLTQDAEPGCSRPRDSGPGQPPAVSVTGFRAKWAKLKSFLARLEGRRITAAALVFTTAYLLFGLGVTEYARSIGRSELVGKGFEHVQIRAMPAAFFPLIRRVVARDAAGDVIAGPVSLLAPRPIDFKRFELPDDPLVERALASDEGETLSWFSDGYVSARVERHEGTGGASVFLVDQRYGFLSAPGASPFGVRFEFGADGSLKGAHLQQHTPDLGVGRELSAMWRLTWGLDE
jgi:inner membrane protein